MHHAALSPVTHLFVQGVCSWHLQRKLGGRESPQDVHKSHSKCKSPFAQRLILTSLFTMLFLCT